ncbi:MAG: NUDIX hydrolase [candidate division KSB1 bacterium]|nr:NUDIX hydrolase [candidate division KSB1 bacterium]
MAEIPLWLKWAREIQALAQTGLTFAHNEYEIDRNRRLMEIAAEIAAYHTDFGKEELLADMLAQPGYATPKIDVRSAVLQDGRILLVKERQDGLWCMPGGWVDVGEGPAEAAAREVREESGYIVEPVKVVAVCDANRTGRPLQLYHAFKIIFLCRLVGGNALDSYETEGADFFSFDSLPPLSENRTHRRHLDMVRAHLIDPSTPTFFD